MSYGTLSFVESTLFMYIWRGLDRNGRNIETARRALPPGRVTVIQPDVWKVIYINTQKPFNWWWLVLPKLHSVHLPFEMKKKKSLFILGSNSEGWFFFMYKLQKSWSLSTWGKIYTLSYLCALALLLNVASDVWHFELN